MTLAYVSLSPQP